MQGECEHYGTDYHGYYILKKEFLLQCLTGVEFQKEYHNEEKYEKVQGNVFLHCDFNLDYLIREVSHPTFDFLKICFLNGKLYVNNWNSIIERKCYVTNIPNPKGYFCVKSLLSDLFESKRFFVKFGYIVSIPKFKFCSACANNQPYYCCDFFMNYFDFTSYYANEEIYNDEFYQDFPKYKQIWNVEDDKDENEETDEEIDLDFNRINVNRLKKRRNLIFRVSKRQLIKNKKKFN